MIHGILDVATVPPSLMLPIVLFKYSLSTRKFHNETWNRRVNTAAISILSVCRNKEDISINLIFAGLNTSFSKMIFAWWVSKIVYSQNAGDIDTSQHVFI